MLLLVSHMGAGPKDLGHLPLPSWVKAESWPGRGETRIEFGAPTGTRTLCAGGARWRISLLSHGAGLGYRFLKNNNSQAGAVAQQGNPPPTAMAHQVLVLVGVPDSIPVAPLPGQLSAMAREGSGGWPKSLGPAPTWETRRSTWLLASDQQDAPAAAAIGG